MKVYSVAMFSEYHPGQPYYADQLQVKTFVNREDVADCIRFFGTHGHVDDEDQLTKFFNSNQEEMGGGLYLIHWLEQWNAGQDLVGEWEDDYGARFAISVLQVM